MELLFREARPADVEDMFSVRGRTRQNPIQREQLAVFGIAPASIAMSMRSGAVKGWVCLHNDNLVGFCIGDGTTGEILVLALLPDYEGVGAGKRLLNDAIDWLWSLGNVHPWLAASSDPSIRAYGFYRALGWKPTGKFLENGDQILRL